MSQFARTFEELDIWKGGRLLFSELGKIFYNPQFRNYAFQDQIMRSCISITNNIAEGFERRKDTQEYIQFLFYAKGSCGEVRSMLYLAKDVGYIDEERCVQLINEVKNLSIKIYNFSESLKK